MADSSIEQNQNHEWWLRDRRMMIMQKMVKEPRPAFRQALYSDLACVCAGLGEPLPALDALPYEKANNSERQQQRKKEHKKQLQQQLQQRQQQHRPLGVEFWQAVREIVKQEIAINHSGSPGVCALNHTEIRAMATARGYKLGGTSDLKHGLAALDAPALLAVNKSMRSRITGRTVRCWVFATADLDDTPGYRKLERARTERLAGLK